jgi:abortive infection bacteriophage resistance protein
LESWIASLAALRNCCAHHARIWNRNYPVTPNIPKKLSGNWISNRNIQPNKLYAQLCATAYLLNVIKRDNGFTQQLKALLAKYPNVDTRAMGFPVDWQDEPLWK